MNKTPQSNKYNKNNDGSNNGRGNFLNYRRMQSLAYKAPQQLKNQNSGSVINEDDEFQESDFNDSTPGADNEIIEPPLAPKNKPFQQQQQSRANNIGDKKSPSTTKVPQESRPQPGVGFKEEYTHKGEDFFIQITHLENEKNELKEEIKESLKQSPSNVIQPILSPLSLKEGNKLSTP